jgi:hypothetical protein
MIAYELFEAAIPFQHLHPVEAARRAAMNHARPTWGATNRCAPLLRRCLSWQLPVTAAGERACAGGT